MHISKTSPSIYNLEYIYNFYCSDNWYGCDLLELRYCGYFGLDLGVDIRDEEDIEFDEDEYTLSID